MQMQPIKWQVGSWNRSLADTGDWIHVWLHDLKASHQSHAHISQDTTWVQVISDVFQQVDVVSNDLFVCCFSLKSRCDDKRAKKGPSWSKGQPTRPQHVFGESRQIRLLPKHW